MKTVESSAVLQPKQWAEKEAGKTIENRTKPELVPNQASKSNIVRGALKGERIAAHLRMSGNHKHTTVAEHMPSSHRRYAGWTIDRIRTDARLIGPASSALCELILEARPHPEQGFRTCLGIVRLAGSYGAERLEAAAERAIAIGARTYGSVKSILDNHLDRRPAHKRATDGTPILHANIRGPRYYN
jgi:transposase